MVADRKAMIMGWNKWISCGELTPKLRTFAIYGVYHKVKIIPDMS